MHLPDFERQHQENLRLVQRLYECFRHKDIDSLLLCLDPDIDWLFQGPATIPFAGHYQRHEGVCEFFHRAFAGADFIEFQPQEFLPSKNHVLVLGHERVRARTSGELWETDWAHVHTIVGGKVVRMREYYDTAVMVEAYQGKGNA